MASLERTSYEQRHDNGNGSNSFEFPKGGGNRNRNMNRSFHPRAVLGSLSKPAPSKWDDAQKWLVGLSSGGGDLKGKPKASHAPSFPSLHGKPLFAPCSIPIGVGVNEEEEEGETKKIDYEKPTTDPASERIPSVCMRDMGTEMTPIASQEPSRTGTPLRATTPSIRSPVTSTPSTPGRSARENYESGLTDHEKTRREIMALGAQLGKSNIIAWATKEEEEQDASKSLKTNDMEQMKINVLEARAATWEEAEQAKYMARYKRDEVKIHAWENNQKIKAEAELGRIEVKIERMKCHAHERLMKKLAKVRRKAEEKHAAAEAKAAKQAVKTAQRANFIRQTGHISSSFFAFNLFSCKSSTLLYDCYH